ncbi:MAG: IS1380 family transposase [Rhodoplanes sp.]|jgi:DDE family transposase
MQTECIPGQLEFEGFDGRRVVAAFDGGAVTSDAGAVLLREADQAIGLIGRVAACFTDHRAADQVIHALPTLIGQRVVAIALGYEDVNDHDTLRRDPVLALFSDRLEPKRKDCAPLAGKSTVHRLEHAPRDGGDRYHKIGHDPKALEAVLVDVFLEAHPEAPKQIIVDLDATDDPVHGHQEGRFFHGYYDCYCYLPLYVFCGRHLLAAKLRPSNIDAAAGAKDEVARLVAHIRRRWPKVRIVLRADSGFAREELMAWCEANDVDYVFGLARNRRLTDAIEAELGAAEAEHKQTGKPARRFKDFIYSTLDSWSHSRRVIGKAEHLDKGANPRFIVTSLEDAESCAQTLYEQLYCARGDMENRIKECQLDLFADRTSTATIAANQLRLWFSSFAYILLSALRRVALPDTELAQATCGSIRLKLLKLGARVTVSVRRIKIAIASACPHQAEFALAHARLRAPPG